MKSVVKMSPTKLALIRNDCDEGERFNSRNIVDPNLLWHFVGED